jgi:hypothetical protein
VKATANIYLDRESDQERVSHLIAGYEEASPLLAFRAARAYVEERWTSIGQLIEEGETLRIEVS